jgi:hypothetical protein
MLDWQENVSTAFFFETAMPANTFAMVHRMQMLYARQLPISILTWSITQVFMLKNLIVIIVLESNWTLMAPCFQYSIVVCHTVNELHCMVIHDATFIWLHFPHVVVGFFWTMLNKNKKLLGMTSYLMALWIPKLYQQFDFRILAIFICLGYLHIFQRSDPQLMHPIQNSVPILDINFHINFLT